MMEEHGIMKKYRDILLASIAAVIAAAAGYPIFLFVIGVIIEPKDYRNAAALGGFIFMFACLVSVAHVAFLGIPAVLLLQKFNVLNLRTIALTGILAGCIPAAFLNVQFVPWAGLFGLCGALAFWAVWSRASHALQPPRAGEEDLDSARD